MAAMPEGVPARPKPLAWVGGSKKDLQALPDEVVHVFGYALYLAQIGQKHEQTKPLRGFGSAGVLEVVEDWRGGTYRDAEIRSGLDQEPVEAGRQVRQGAGR